MSGMAEEVPKAYTNATHGYEPITTTAQIVPGINRVGGLRSQSRQTLIGMENDSTSATPPQLHGRSSQKILLHLVARSAISVDEGLATFTPAPLTFCSSLRVHGERLFARRWSVRADQATWGNGPERSDPARLASGFRTVKSIGAMRTAATSGCDSQVADCGRRSGKGRGARSRSGLIWSEGASRKPTNMRQCDGEKLERRGRVDHGWRVMQSGMSSGRRSRGVIVSHDSKEQRLGVQ